MLLAPAAPEISIACERSFALLQIDVNAPKRRIDSAFRLADHRPDPSPLNQPLPRAELAEARRISSS